MIYIVTALQIEASPIIEYFKLKRDITVNAYQVYKNNEMALIVGGVGKVKSAMAAAYLLTSCNSSKSDVLLNIGFCGASSKVYPLGSLLLINKVRDIDTGRDYYPDLYTGRSLPQAALCCCTKPMGQSQPNGEGDFYCDMEASGIMEAARKFIYAHKVVILKIISDYLTPEILKKEELKGYIQNQMPCVEELIKELKDLDDSSERTLTEDEEKLISTISENLRFSNAMKQQLSKEVWKAKLHGVMPDKIFEAYGSMQVNSKAEGKRAFERIIGELKQGNV